MQFHIPLEERHTLPVTAFAIAVDRRKIKGVFCKSGIFAVNDLHKLGKAFATDGRVLVGNAE